MNPTVYLDELFFRASRPDGGVGGFGEFPPLESYNPRLDCTTPALLDFAIGAILRVKEYTLKVSYSVTDVTVHGYSNGSQVVETTAGSDGTASVDASVANPYISTPNEGLILGGVPAAYPIEDGIVHRGFEGGLLFRASADDEEAGKDTHFTPALMLHAGLPNAPFPYVFSFAGAVLIERLDDDNGYVLVGSWGSEEQDAGWNSVPIKFLGKDFPGRTSYPDTPTSSGSPGTATLVEFGHYKIYRPTKLEITAKTYWSYDGKFDTATGAPA